MKRFLFVTAVAATLSAATLTAVAQDSSNGQVTYTGWKGVSPATAASASTTDEKAVYLYNVDLQAFLTRGGRWGTEAVLGGSNDLVLPFTVSATTTQGYNSSTYYTFNTQTTAQSSSSAGALGFTGTTATSEDGTPSAWDKYNYFTDINSSSYQNWTRFTATEVNSGSNTYRFSQAVQSNWGNNNQTAGTYYLQGTSTYNSNSSSTSGRDNYVTATTTATDKGTTWKLVTLKEIKDYAKSVTNIDVEADPVTYAIYDPDYGRKDESISSWKTGTNGSSSLSQGWAQTNTTQSYYVGNGLDDNQSAGQDTNGGDMAANIYGAGKIYQDITTSNLPAAGWYEVSCNIITTESEADKVKLYASVGGSTTYSATQTPYAEKAAQHGITISPATYLGAAQLVNTTTKDDNGNTAYLYRVICSVYVGTTSGSSSLQSLQIGVDATSASSTAWTVVDNWQMRYLGNPTSIVILDETKESVDYLKNQNKNSDGTALTMKSTVYMHRSLVAGKWNSIVLPFDLSNQAIISKFGSGTIVAEFKGATNENAQNDLYFTAANDIQKGKLYLIKPTIGEPSNGTNVTVMSSHDNSLKLTDKFYRFESVNFGGTDATFPETVVNTDETKKPYGGDTNLYFVGTYIQKLNCVATGSYFLLAANQQTGEGSDGLWKILSAGDKCNMRGFRGWLSPVDPTKTASARFHIFGIADGDPTSIDGIPVNTPVVRPALSGVYNLQGQRVADGTSLDGLPHGLYIVNGQKVMK